MNKLDKVMDNFIIILLVRLSKLLNCITAKPNNKLTALFDR